MHTLAERLLELDESWTMGVDDPTIGGWLVALAYVVAAVASFAAMRRYVANARLLDGVDSREASDQRTLGRLWLLVGVLMLALAANKQLDLQTLVSEKVRAVARSQGWYDNRRPLQAAVIALIGLLSIVVVAAATYLLRRVWRRALPVVAAVVVVVAFAGVRAISLHQIDAVLGAGGGWPKRSLELLATLVVVWLAVRARAGAAPDGVAYLDELMEPAPAPTPSHIGLKVDRRP